jgi:hypothetical protein
MDNLIRMLEELWQIELEHNPNSEHFIEFQSSNAHFGNDEEFAIYLPGRKEIPFYSRGKSIELAALACLYTYAPERIPKMLSKSTNELAAGIRELIFLEGNLQRVKLSKNGHWECKIVGIRNNGEAGLGQTPLEAVRKLSKRLIRFGGEILRQE